MDFFPQPVGDLGERWKARDLDLRSILEIRGASRGVPINSALVPINSAPFAVR